MKIEHIVSIIINLNNCKLTKYYILIMLKNKIYHYNAIMAGCQ